MEDPTRAGGRRKSRWVKIPAMAMAAGLALIFGFWLALPSWVERFLSAALLELGFAEAEARVARVGWSGLQIESLRASSPRIQITMTGIEVAWHWKELRDREIRAITIEDWTMRGESDRLTGPEAPIWAWPLQLPDAESEPAWGIKCLSLPSGNLHWTMGREEWNATLSAGASWPLSEAREWQFSIKTGPLAIDGRGLHDPADGSLRIDLRADGPDSGDWFVPLISPFMEEPPAFLPSGGKDWRMEAGINRPPGESWSTEINLSFSTMAFAEIGESPLALEAGRATIKARWDPCTEWTEAAIQAEGKVKNLLWSDIRSSDASFHWTGTLADGLLRIQSILPGVEQPLSIEQELRQEENGWRGIGRLDLPRSRFTLVEEAAPWLDPGNGLQGEGWIEAQGRIVFFAGDSFQLSTTGDVRLEETFLSQGGEREIRGMTLALPFRQSLDGGWRTDGPATMAFESLSLGNWATGAGETRFRFHWPEAVEVDFAEVKWAGGNLIALPFAFHPRRPDFTITLRAEGVQIQELVDLIPDLRGRAEGLLDGRLALRISPDGFGLEPGFLLLQPHSGGRLRMRPGNWFSSGMRPGQVAYEQVRTIERSLEDLDLSRFRLDFPDPEQPDVQLRIALEGRPANPAIKVPSIGLTVNVRGPVREIANWAMGSGARVQISK